MAPVCLMAAIQTPASTGGSFALAKDGSQHWYHLNRPAVHRRVVNENASILHIISSMCRRLSG